MNCPTCGKSGADATHRELECLYCVGILELNYSWRLAYVKGGFAYCQSTWNPDRWIRAYIGYGTTDTIAARWKIVSLALDKANWAEARPHPESIRRAYGDLIIHPSDECPPFRGRNPFLVTSDMPNVVAYPVNYARR